MIQIYYEPDSLKFLDAVPFQVDHIITDPLYDADFSWYATCRKVCPTGNILAFCKPENQWPNPDEYLFWIKPLSTKNFSRKCGRFVEIISVYRDWNTFHRIHWSQMTGVYHDLIVEEIGHPWQKPLSLLERLIRIYTNVGDTILDPFAGSGSTGVACKNLGRGFIGVENNFDYFTLMAKRLEITDEE